jgi:hypothetical protein
LSLERKTRRCDQCGHQQFLHRDFLEPSVEHRSRKLRRGHGENVTDRSYRECAPDDGFRECAGYDSKSPRPVPGAGSNSAMMNMCR